MPPWRTRRSICRTCAMSSSGNSPGAPTLRSRWRRPRRAGSRPARHSRQPSAAESHAARYNRPPMAQPRSSQGQTSLDPAQAHRRRPQRRWYLRLLLFAFVVAWASIAIWQTHKPLPLGTDVASAWAETPLGEVHLLTDVTVTDGRERLLIRQQIFDEVLRTIDTAQEFIVLDWFLFNDHRGPAANQAPAPHRALSAELRDRLAARLRAKPDLRVLFITDPINDIY